MTIHQSLRHTSRHYGPLVLGAGAPDPLVLPGSRRQPECRSDRRSAVLRRWLRRYLPAEVSGIFGALLCAWLASRCTTAPGAIALAGTGGENLGYFGMLFARECAERSRQYRRQIIRELALEFGPATAMDSLVFSPILLYISILLAPNLPLGIAIGTLFANCAFYIPVIATHERLRHRRALHERVPPMIAVPHPIFAMDRTSLTGEDAAQVDARVLGQYRERSPWGLATAVDLGDCDPRANRDVDCSRSAGSCPQRTSFQPSMTTYSGKRSTGFPRPASAAGSGAPRRCRIARATLISCAASVRAAMAVPVPTHVARRHRAYASW